MTTYTYSEARQKFASVLERAKQEGEVLIKRKDGSSFTIKPVLDNASPLAVSGIDTDVTSEEIIDIIHEVRKR